MPMLVKSPLLNSEEAAGYVRRPEPWLRKARVYGGGPPFVKMGHLVFYRREALDEWLAGLERRSTGRHQPVAA